MRKNTAINERDTLTKCVYLPIFEVELIFLPFVKCYNFIQH